jgi:hypothetical protein
MKRTSLLVLGACSIFYLSCSDQTTIFERQSENLELETNQTVLDNSVILDNAGVLDIFSKSRDTGKFSRFLNEQAGKYPLALVAQIAPPSFNGGENLTATHVYLEGDYAYVSYNTAGETYAGAIDIVNVADPNRPVLSSRVRLTNADLSSIIFDDGYVYGVGGVDSEQSAIATSNSFVIKLTVVNGRFDLDSGFLLGFQEGFVATDVETIENEVIVTSGKDGLVTRYDKSTLEIIDEVAYADLRSVDISNNTIAVLDAAHGARLLDFNLSELSSIPISADFRIADKRTLALMNDKIVVSEGADGAAIYDLNTGSLLERTSIPINPENTAQSDIVTNSVTVNDDIFLMANGGAGLSMSEGVTSASSTNQVGIIELNGSINYVESRDDYIFAASGRNGLQIIKMNKPSASLQAKCETSPRYSGSARLNVATDQNLAYSGSRRFNTIDVSGSLLLCGTWTVRNEVNINENALFEMQGTFIVARNNRRRNLRVGENGTFRVEGNLTIYGDLILEDGASLEFLGNDSTVNIFGDVQLGDNVTISGTFDDVQNKF